MFICKDCAPQFKYVDGDNLGVMWDYIGFRSYGCCEVCGKTSVCIDKRSGTIERDSSISTIRGEGNESK